MKIIFKEVGQGDSIILEWVSDTAEKIALIDCNRKDDGSNPVLNHLIQAGARTIEFILLTHPHTDHFSGMHDVLEYCEKNNIAVNNFLHTARTIPEALRAAVSGITATKELDKLFMKIEALYDAGIIKNILYIDNHSREIHLEENWTLKFLAPTHAEYRDFNSKKYKNPDEVLANSSDANLLSTFIKIYNNNRQLFLSGDTMKHVFKRFEKQGLQEFRTMLVLGQVPHHGSGDNFHKTFWRLLHKQPKAPVVVSVGKNIYNHPSEKVIAALEEMDFQPMFTNTPSFAALPPFVRETDSSLDLISTKVLPPSGAGTFRSADVVFDTHDFT